VKGLLLKSLGKLSQVENHRNSLPQTIFYGLNCRITLLFLWAESNYYKDMLAENLVKGKIVLIGGLSVRLYRLNY
jgi:hypothetical protein